MKQKTLRKISLAIVIALLSPFMTFGQQQDINLLNRFQINKDGSYIQFKTTMAGFPVVRGSISAYQATIYYDPNDIMKTSATLRIGSEGFNTAHPRRDETLQGKGFLNSQEHPGIWFQGDQVTKTDKGFDLTGDMYIKGIVKPVTINMTKPTVMKGALNGQDMMMAQGMLKINRKDFDLGTSGPWASNPMLGDEIEIEFNFMGFSYTLQYLKGLYVRKVNGRDHAVGVIYNEVKTNGLESGMKKIGELAQHKDYANENWLSNAANIGWMLLVDGMGKEAVAFFEQALQRNPNHTVSLLRIGDAYTVAGQHDKALEHFKKERSLDARMRFTHIPEMIKKLGGKFELKNMK